MVFSCMDWRDYIVYDPEVLVGKPVLKGTRMSVELILELLSEGWEQDDILQSYPSLTHEDFVAIFLYLKDCVKHQQFFPINKAV